MRPKTRPRRFAPEPLEQRALLSGLSATIDQRSDPDANGMVLTRKVAIIGTANAGERVVLERSGHSRPVATARVGSSGAFGFRTALPWGPSAFEVVDRTSGTSVQVLVSRGDAVIDSNDVAIAQIRAAGTSPPIASRDLAMAEAAVHDAVAATRGEAGYLVTMPKDRGASATVAAAEAARTVLAAVLPGGASSFSAMVDEAEATVPNRRARARGEALGQAVGSAILAQRANDGSASAASVAAPTPGGPGHWVPTPPKYLPGLLPGWGQVQPFAISSASAFQPPPPPAFNSPQFVADLQEVESLGSKNSTTRTADQTAIAQFWSDGVDTFTPIGQWNQIAEIAALSKPQALARDARTFALLDLAEADAGIVCWACKWTDDTVRPVTEIRQAAANGTPGVASDPSWTPLLTTPNFPSYISGHSTFSAAASAVLTSVFGPNFAFTDPGDPTVGVQPRHFTSFDQAAQEAGISRIYGGIHYPSDNTAGLSVGEAVGEAVVKKFG